MKKLDNKGFTLVELLAVIVILIGLMSVTVPALSASLGKNKEKTLERNMQLIENASEFYVSNNKDKVFEILGNKNKCYVSLESLRDDNYVDENTLIDGDGNSLVGGAVVIFNKDDYTFTYTNVDSSLEGINECSTGASIEAKNFAVGNYVKMVPYYDSYSIPASITGADSNQPIHPQELNLWRVTNVDESGTTMVSVGVSSDKITFKGLTGYVNYISALNTMAAYYTKNPYTKTTRHIGYVGQTQVITDLSKFTENEPWTCNSGGDCNPSPDEKQGGGDLVTGVNSDYVSIANQANYRSYNDAEYCFASRAYKKTGEPEGYTYSWNINFIDIKDGEVNPNFEVLYGNKGEGLIETSFSCAIRPIVVIYSKYKCEGGDGKTIDNPCVLN